MHALLDAYRRLRPWCEAGAVQGLRPHVRRALDVGLTDELDVPPASRERARLEAWERTSSARSGDGSTRPTSAW